VQLLDNAENNIKKRKKPKVVQPQNVYNRDKSTVIQNISEYVQHKKPCQREREREEREV
jgi:hypothetical protein